MITVDLGKAKGIAHAARRLAREELFKPLDIQATIPMYAEAAEAQRQEIRERFAKYQEDIDNATCSDSLKQAMFQCNCQ